MKKSEKVLIRSFKRMIHILSTGKNIPVKYGDVYLYRAEVHVLEMVANSPGITATQLTKEMDVTKGAISQIVIKLINKGLVAKKEKADNLKIKELYLTNKGKEVNVNHILREKALMELLRGDLNCLSDEDIEVFSKIVDRISDHIVGE